MSNQGTITTPVGRLSFPSVFTPRPAMDPSKPDSYECGIIFAPGTDLTPIREAIDAVLAEQFGKKPRPSGLKNPLRDGAEKEGIAGMGAGTFFITARSQRKVPVVDAHKIGITDEEEVYGGCNGRLAVRFFWFDKAGNRGVGVSLQAVQKISDNDPFASVVDVDEAFGDAPTGATAGNTSGW